MFISELIVPCDTIRLRIINIIIINKHWLEKEVTKIIYRYLYSQTQVSIHTRYGKSVGSSRRSFTIWRNQNIWYKFKYMLLNCDTGCPHGAKFLVIEHCNKPVASSIRLKTMLTHSYLFRSPFANCSTLCPSIHPSVCWIYLFADRPTIDVQWSFNFSHLANRLIIMFQFRN